MESKGGGGRHIKDLVSNKIKLTKRIALAVVLAITFLLSDFTLAIASTDGTMLYTQSVFGSAMCGVMYDSSSPTGFRFAWTYGGSPTGFGLTLNGATVIAYKSFTITPNNYVNSGVAVSSGDTYTVHIADNIYTGTIKILPPSPPIELQASNITKNSLDLSWSTTSGATSYVLFQDGNQISTTTGTTYHITNLNPSTAYSFQIAAVNGVGQSPLSNKVNATTLGIPPIAPNGLSADNITQTSFTLYWLKQSDATSYNVYLDGTLAGNVSQPLVYNPSFDISNLADGSTHSVTVTAVNQWGESTASQPLSVTTTVPTPVLKAIIDNSKINLTWTGIGSSFDIMVNNILVTQATASPYTLTEKPGTYQIQVIQNYNGQQYPSNIISVKISALQNVGAAQMTGDLLSNTGVVIAPVGGLIALALVLKGSPMLLAAAKAFFLKS
ncbi:fibronectin type III domain-containing protein [Desulfosporosinus metallidurans]|uniref:Chitinase n=1 Tax=Desulfosporosinus metallidurans TaxID=1888891 RepID=A0A1Q8QRD5_9FIRM|nr:fibronectin type III domain-containing protein [Desulfosporosinus metallidurans]OLN29923.1 Chitinase [Desulfosporosinus metallidurans]